MALAPANFRFNFTPGGGVTTGTLAWDASADASSGYRIRWGTSSGSYSNSQSVGAGVTSIAFSSLSPQMTTDVTYYMVVEAYNGVDYSDAYGEFVVLNGVLIG